MRKETVASIIAGAGTGTAAIFILKEYVDKKYGPVTALPLPSELKLNTYTALVGIGGGALATVLGGVMPALTGKTYFSENINTFLTAMGITMLAGGILSTVTEKEIPAAALAGTPPTVTIVPPETTKEAIYA